MILDKIENYKLYLNISDRIAKAFAYIEKTDLSQMPLGKHLIDNDDIFALVQEYETKEEVDCKLEAHWKYIDIQYVTHGAEVMGITSLKDQVPTYVNKEDDLAFYEGDSTPIEVGAGMFTIFFPDDIHKPCMKSKQSATVRKVVIKVRA